MNELISGAYITNGQALARETNSITAFRERHRLSQEQLGRVVARGRTTVSAWENGAPPDLAAQRLLWAIDANPDLVRSLAASPITVEDPGGKLRDFILGSSDVRTEAHPIGDPANDKFLITHRNARLDVALEVLRTMATQPGAAGGYLTGETLREPILAPVLGGRLGRLGVVYEDLPRPALDQLTAVALDLPTAQWLAEGAEVTETTPALQRHGAPLREVGCGVSHTRRLAVQSAGRAERLVSQMVVRSLARAIDAAVLTGDGILQPLGLLAQAPALGVAAIDAAALLDAIEDLEGQGVDSERLGVVAGPGVKRTTGAITHDGGALWRTAGGQQLVAGLPALSTDLMPAGTLLIGDFSTVVASHEQDVHLVQRARGADDTRETFAFLTVAVSTPLPESFVRVYVNG